MDAFENVRSMVEEAINAPAHADKPLYVTGHSLGGAVATVAAKKLAHPGGIAACYSFGAPRVGGRRLDHRSTDADLPPGQFGGLRHDAAAFERVRRADRVVPSPGIESAHPLCLACDRLARLKVEVGVRGIPPRRRHALSDQLPSRGPTAKSSFCTRWACIRRLYWISRLKKWPPRKFLADHSISVYRSKLMVVAERRN